MKNQHKQLSVVDESVMAPIQARIKYVRNIQVMLDRDLAELYGVPVKRLNEQVKRNLGRFPADFMFQLTKDDCLRSQIATLNGKRGTHLKYLPYAFFSLSTTSSCTGSARPSTASAVASLPTPPATRRRLRSCWLWFH